MTIGIALSGPGAGYGIFKALEAVEAVGRGAIGGFVSFAVITASGELLRAQTQDGGTATLFGGGEPPPEIARAETAVLMSSGPNRPEPLAQFTPGEAGVGLVTGHRLPNVAAEGRQPPNLMILQAMREGDSVQNAVASALESDPQADAGLIALSTSGEIALGDTAFVTLRKDKASLVFKSDDGSVTGAVTHNSIFPVRGLAELVAGVALDCLEEPDRCDLRIVLDRTVEIVPADAEGVHIDDEGRVRRVEVDRRRIPSGSLEGALFLHRTPVYCGGSLVGHVSGQEPYTIVTSLRAQSFSGAPGISLAVKRTCR